jgi:hypothetical protein
MEIEHHRSAWRFARRRYRGPRAVVLPFVAALLVLRAAAGIVREALASRRSGWGSGRCGDGPVTGGVPPAG